MTKGFWIWYVTGSVYNYAEYAEYAKYAKYAKYAEKAEYENYAEFAEHANRLKQLTPGSVVPMAMFVNSLWIEDHVESSSLRINQI